LPKLTGFIGSIRCGAFAAQPGGRQHPFRCHRNQRAKHDSESCPDYDFHATPGEIRAIPNKIRCDNDDAEAERDTVARQRTRHEKDQEKTADDEQEMDQRIIGREDHVGERYGEGCKICNQNEPSVSQHGLRVLAGNRQGIKGAQKSVGNLEGHHQKHGDDTCDHHAEDGCRSTRIGSEFVLQEPREPVEGAALVC